MTDRTRIQVGGGEVELVGAGSAHGKSVIETALAAVDRSQGDGPVPPARLHANPAARAASLFWSPVLHATGYFILRPSGPSAARYPDDAKDRTMGVSYIDTGLTPGQTYYYAVASENAAHRISEPSEICTVMIEPEIAPEPLVAPSPDPPVPPALPPGTPPWTPVWTPTIGQPAWGELDVAETRLESLLDVMAGGLRPYVLASLHDELPYRSDLTTAIDEIRDRGHGRPCVGLTFDPVSFERHVASQPALVTELGGLADDLGRLGVGLAIRLDG